MNAILGIGRYLYAIPFAIFGVFHFMNTSVLSGMAPGGDITVYITGLALIAAAVSMLIGKYDKLAAFLLGVMLILFALIIHLSSAMEGDASQFLKDLSLAGAAWMYAGNVAKDNSVLG